VGDALFYQVATWKVQLFVYTERMPHRSYDQYCSVARALDVVGERWALLIVRELLAGPRRYTDLHADLPGVSTDVLASRLKDLERDGLAVRRRLTRSGATYVYELTPRGRGLLPVLAALADWGTPALEERRPTDAVRAHWLAIPLLARLTPLTGPHTGTVGVELDEGAFHLRFDESGPGYGDGPAEQPDVRLALSAATCLEVTRGTLALARGVKEGRIELHGSGTLADALAER